jgi:hypothetical protein
MGDETIPEEEEEEDPVEAGNMPPSPSTLKLGIGSAVLRIGPPRKRKKITPLPLTTPLSSRVPDFVIRQFREEEENTQEAAGSVPSNLPAVRKKRRLKPTSDVRPKREKELLASPSRNSTQEHAEPRDQEESMRANLPHPDHVNELAEPLPELIPPRTTKSQIPPDPPANGNFSTPTLPHTMKNAKKLAPIPRLEPSHFKPYLKAADITSVIDEYSPKRSFPTQDTIEPSVQGPQVRRTVTQPPNKSFEPTPVDDLFDGDITQKMQDVEDAYLNLDGQANGIGTPDEEQPTTVSNVDQSILTPFLLINRRTLIRRNRSHFGPSRPQKASTRRLRSVHLFFVSDNRTNRLYLDAVIEQPEAGRRACSSKPKVRRD